MGKKWRGDGLVAQKVRALGIPNKDCTYCRGSGVICSDCNGHHAQIKGGKSCACILGGRPHRFIEAENTYEVMEVYFLKMARFGLDIEEWQELVWP